MPLVVDEAGLSRTASGAVRSLPVGQHAVGQHDVGQPAVGQHDVVERWFRAMNTDVHVVVVGGGEGALDQAEELVADREARWSRFLPDSELTVVNNAAGRPVVVTRETFAIVAKAIQAWEATGGTFDPTIGTSMRSAGYDRTLNSLTPISTSGIGRSDFAGYRPAPTPLGVQLDDMACAITVQDGVSLDLGGIAKGETAETVVAALLASGVAGCCVNIGGDLRAEGRSPGNEGWTVTLDCPGSPEQRAVALEAGAVCTSTTVKRRWASANGTEHHLRDPETGASFDTGILSVSVVAARADQAEVLTKAAMAAGVDGAEAVVTERGATGLLVDASGSVQAFAGFERFSFDKTHSSSLTSNQCMDDAADVSGVEPGS